MHSERDIKKSVVVDLWLQRLLDSVVGVRFNTQPRIYLVIDSEAANQSSDVEWPFFVIVPEWVAFLQETASTGGTFVIRS